LKLARFPTRSPPLRGFTFYLADPISSIAQISADSDYQSGKKEIRKWGRGFETCSAPALTRCYPRSFAFYLGNPFPRFCVPRFLIKSSVPICVNPWHPWFPSAVACAVPSAGRSQGGIRWGQRTLQPFWQNSRLDIRAAGMAKSSPQVRPRTRT
jgi:hypothetical protein